MVEPEDEAGDGDDGAVVGGEFVVAGGQAAEAFELVEAAFDDVAAAVAVPVEAAAAVSAAGAGGELVAAFGDGVRDAPPAQLVADDAGGVALVGDQVPGPGARSARPGPRDGDGFDDLDQPGAVVDVAGGEGEGQRQAAPVAGQVDLGGQSAAGSPERLPEFLPAGR
ncbi:hypothetical protein BJY14_007736 [Actinomadura luteofluorescens]|uniref:Uncharacterized protein n=1 Tax=Actinomadura luteofluorescens TaxID=46163 RepID=A0A7Y9EPN2_9ACTN|nr:hypothetical protein [Actinomadura luteofluorescens]NYD51753.1 hypothetical protein [Actinomadura luteofluorescens]